MKLRAYAKINLGLLVLGKRPDGYHNIETVFRLIDIYDEVDFLQNDGGIVFKSDSALLADDNTNLCVRAANLLRDLTGIHVGVDITLTKRIPLGAGLGGGSSDAAAVLKGLTKLWALDISTEELQTISATLGSDVPFFFQSPTAFAQGRGERLTPFDLTIPYWILVATPPIHVSTGWAYSHLTLQPPEQRPDLITLLLKDIGNPAILRTHLVNDFEESVCQRFPEIAELKHSMLTTGAVFSLMSGSGSSVFGFFDSDAAASRAQEKLSRQHFTALTSPSFSPEIN